MSPAVAIGILIRGARVCNWESAWKICDNGSSFESGHHHGNDYRPGLPGQLLDLLENLQSGWGFQETQIGSADLE